MADFGTVDISLTSISSRLPTLPHTLRSLLRQSYGDLCVNLYLSHEPYLLDKGVEEIPEDIRALQDEAGERLKITFCPNWGPYRKLLPLLHETWGQSRLIVTVDDDTIYPETWLQGMVDAYDTHRCVIGYRGHRINVRDGRIAHYRSWMRNPLEENPDLLILPTGKDGVLYNSAFFPINVLNITDALRTAPTVDDLWFRWHLLFNRIPVYLINMDYTSDTFDETGYDSSLYLNFNLGGGNDAAIARLQDYFQDQFGVDVTAAAQRS